MDPITIALSAGSVGSSLLGGMMGSNSAQAAAAQQAAAAKEAAGITSTGITQGGAQVDAGYGNAIGATNTGYGNALTALGPSSHAAIDSFNGAAGVGMTPQQYQAQLQSGFKTDPGYAFQFQQGQDALDRSANARGMLYSGNQTQAAIDYGNGVANTAYGNYLNQNNARVGQLGQAASNEYGNNTNIANTYTGQGNALSQLAVGRGEAAGTTTASAASANAAGVYGAGQAQAQGTAASGTAWQNALQGIGNSLSYGAGRLSAPTGYGYGQTAYPNNPNMSYGGPR